MSGASKEGAPPKPLSTREQIPKADFIEDIDGYMAKEGSAEVVLEKLQRQYNALKFIESKLVQEKAKMKVKVPELAKTVDSLVQMDAQAERGEELVTHYELAQSVYAKARVKLITAGRRKTTPALRPSPKYASISRSDRCVSSVSGKTRRIMSRRWGCVASVVAAAVASMVSRAAIVAIVA